MTPLAPLTRTDVPDVAAILERLRLAEARLARRRQQQSGMTESDRGAMRYVLERVDGEQVTPSKLARGLHLSPAAGTALIDRLVARGLLSVQPHPSDRRQKILQPLDRNIDPDHIDPLTMRLRAIAAELEPEEARIIAAFLDDVLAAVSDPANAGVQG
jgi:DNA-binding MarR family transcriptional regulator